MGMWNVCVKRDCALKIIVGIKHILDQSGRMWVVALWFMTIRRLVPMAVVQNGQWSMQAESPSHVQIEQKFRHDISCHIMSMTAFSPACHVIFQKLVETLLKPEAIRFFEKVNAKLDAQQNHGNRLVTWFNLGILCISRQSFFIVFFYIVFSSFRISSVFFTILSV